MPQWQFLFSAIFVFQKSYTGNILGIGWNETRISYFAVMKTQSKWEAEKGQEAATAGGRTGAPLAAPPGGVGPLGALWHRPSAYKFPPMWKP
jgi:hypothetical protein